MCRGTKFLKSSKNACGKFGASNRPFGHQREGGIVYLNYHCGCKKNKSLSSTSQQLEIERD